MLQTCTYHFITTTTTLTCTHTHAHTHTLTRTCTHIYTHIHTHTQTHKYRHFQQPLWTHPQYQTPICTLTWVIKFCSENYQLPTSCSTWRKYTSCTSSSTTDVSQRSVAHCFHCVPEVANLKFMFTCSSASYGSCMFSVRVFGFLCLGTAWAHLSKHAIKSGPTAPY